LKLSNLQRDMDFRKMMFLSLKYKSKFTIRIRTVSWNTLQSAGLDDSLLLEFMKSISREMWTSSVPCDFWSQNSRISSCS